MIAFWGSMGETCLAKVEIAGGCVGILLCNIPFLIIELRFMLLHLMSEGELMFPLPK